MLKVKFGRILPYILSKISADVPLKHAAKMPLEKLGTVKWFKSCYNIIEWPELEGAVKITLPWEGTPSLDQVAQSPTQPGPDICSGTVILILVLWLSDYSWVLILTAPFILCVNAHTSLDIELLIDNCLSEKSQSSLFWEMAVLAPLLRMLLTIIKI